MVLADGQPEIAPQASGLSKHGHTLGRTGKFSGQKHFLRRVAYCSVHQITKTARLTTLTRGPWSAHRVCEYKQVVPRVRFVYLGGGHYLTSCAYRDIQTVVVFLAYRWLSTKPSCHLSPFMFFFVPGQSPTPPANVSVGALDEIKTDVECLNQLHQVLDFILSR